MACSRSLAVCFLIPLLFVSLLNCLDSTKVAMGYDGLLCAEFYVIPKSNLVVIVHFPKIFFINIVSVLESPGQGIIVKWNTAFSFELSNNIFLLNRFFAVFEPYQIFDQFLFLTNI